MSSPLENLTFRIAQHRTVHSTPIHSFKDPWLGIDVQLMPLPEGLFRILIVAVPTFLLPHLLDQLKAMPGEESRAEVLITQLDLFRKLYLHPNLILDTMKKNRRRLNETRADQIRTLLKLRQNTLLFYIEDIDAMKKCWYRNFSILSLPRRWSGFIYGRKYGAIKDVSDQEESSQKGKQDEEDDVESLISTSDIPRFRDGLGITESVLEDNLSDTSSSVTISQPFSSLIQEREGDDSSDAWSTPLQSPTTPRAIPSIDAEIPEESLLTEVQSTEVQRTNTEAERALDLLYLISPEDSTSFAT